MPFPKALLERAAAGFGLMLTPAQLDLFAVYADFLAEYNEKVNLTALTDGESVALLHFADSLLLLTALTPPENASLIDVGSGAGFPGAVLGIVRPDLRLTLLDARGKRADFLRALSERLGQRDNTVLHARAEQAALAPPLRDGFDIAAARAVAGLPALCELCLPFVRPGGCFAAMKGPAADGEQAAAARAIGLLGGGNARAARRELPNGERRLLVLIDKLRPTPPAYPRQRVNIAKNPL